MRSRPFLAAEDFLLVLICVIWGTNYVVVKSALDELSPLAFNGLRFPLAAALLLLLQWRVEGFAPVRPYLRSLVWLGLVGNLGYQLFFIFGLDHTRAGQASVFASTTPLFTFLFAQVSGHDRVGRRVLIGLVLATAGVVLLLWESIAGTFSGQGLWVGDLLLLGSAACWAAYTVYSQPLLLHLQPLALTSVSMAAGAVPLFLLAVPEILALQPSRVSFGAWGGMLYAALFAIVFCYLGWSRAVRILGSTRTSAYLNLVPVVAVVVAWWWLAEAMSAFQILGAIAVIAGIAVSRGRGGKGRRAAGNTTG